MSLDYHPFKPLLDLGQVTCSAWARGGSVCGYEGVITPGVQRGF